MLLSPLWPSSFSDARSGEMFDIWIPTESACWGGVRGVSSWCFWLFRVWMLRVLGFEFRVPGSRLRFAGFGFRVSGSGLQVSSFGFRVSGFGFQVSGFRVSGFGFRGQGFRFGFEGLGSSLCCPPRQKSRVERLRVEVEPLSTKVTVDSGSHDQVECRPRT